MILTKAFSFGFIQSSLSSPDIFDSPSPEEDKEEHISLAHRGIDVSKKTSKTVTISQVSDQPG
jgi:SH3 domain-containing kinase-binding protein 1